MRRRGDDKEAGVKLHSPPQVDRIWGIWGSYSNIPKAIIYLRGDLVQETQAAISCCASAFGNNAAHCGA